MNMIDFSDTIQPKSDQLNADDMLVGPMTVKIIGVRRGSKEQPVVIELDGGIRPYLPCKSMRRVLISAWGAHGSEWVGKSMTLYRDPAVKFGGVALGGIRISHLSELERDMTMMLTTARGRRAGYTVKLLTESASGATIEHVLAAIESAQSSDELLKASDMSKSLSEKDKPAARAAYSAKSKTLRGEL